MGNMIEIRWHGRGGQGTVTAAKMLADASLEGGKYVQASPEYGAERMGAPLRAFNRISDEEIFLHCSITNPDIVVVVDPSLVKQPAVTEGIEESTTFVVNSPLSAKEVRDLLHFQQGKVYTVDATKIALETLGRNIPNTPMLGALIKATGILQKETLISELKKGLEKKFGAKIVQHNVDAVERAFQEVQGDE
ncbi:pyruvate synthase [candidate division KSB3 bacterium]|uniref:Pyruvate synthase n=1 Tax=candidate division KSB3 bacterium TaxID=2044937 RepID=A0A9D5JVP9_9BACT|nr:pyruvate synthase [candidate division KSB3 bacterium]MBD3325015.1 pyruvate synthase [candidate division KSB3 bacterium]